MLLIDEVYFSSLGLSGMKTTEMHWVGFFFFFESSYFLQLHFGLLSSCHHLLGLKKDYLTCLCKPDDRIWTNRKVRKSLCSRF